MQKSAEKPIQQLQPACSALQHTGKQAALPTAAESSGKQLTSTATATVTGKRQRKEAQQKQNQATKGESKRAKLSPAEPQPAAAKAHTATASLVSDADPIFGRQWAALEPSQILGSHDSEAVTSFKPTPNTKHWWGASTFVTAGQLDGIQRKTGAAERKEFSEEDQTTLYNKLQDAKTSGKGGLGKNAAPLPGAACRDWHTALLATGRPSASHRSSAHKLRQLGSHHCLSHLQQQEEVVAAMGDMPAKGDG